MSNECLVINSTLSTLSPAPSPQSPVPNPQSPIPKLNKSLSTFCGLLVMMSI
ncbi:hypothetical protein ACQFX9_12395 [Aliinostoc sp. HNIBRCY26]|uniref:hypothetical protein n=1 Tax=Aliinostoc sp. HNIBRCY26 TaxID=3418997 RepID=UPI003CFC7F31